MRFVERFTSTGPDNIEWRVTVEIYTDQTLHLRDRFQLR